MVGPLRSPVLKPQQFNAHPIPFGLGEHFEVAILVRVHQGHHGHTAQRRSGGGKALGLEGIEERGEAKGNSEPPEVFAAALDDWSLARTYRLLPSELDRLTLYDIWCSNIGPLWEQALSKVKK